MLALMARVKSSRHSQQTSCITFEKKHDKPTVDCLWTLTLDALVQAKLSAVNIAWYTGTAPSKLCTVQGFGNTWSAPVKNVCNI